MKRSNYSFGYDPLPGLALRRLSDATFALLEGGGSLSIVDGGGSPISDIRDIVPRLLATLDARDATIEELRANARRPRQERLKAYAAYREKALLPTAAALRSLLTDHLSNASDLCGIDIRVLSPVQYLIGSQAAPLEVRQDLISVSLRVRHKGADSVYATVLRYFRPIEDTTDVSGMRRLVLPLPADAVPPSLRLDTVPRYFTLTIGTPT